MEEYGLMEFEGFETANSDTIFGNLLPNYLRVLLAYFLVLLYQHQNHRHLPIHIYLKQLPEFDSDLDELYVQILDTYIDPFLQNHHEILSIETSLPIDLHHQVMQ